jgi:glycosyltransferase 2 family protein
MVEPKPHLPILKRLSPWIRIGVTLGILGFLAGKVNWPNLGQRFTSAHPGWLIAAFLVSLLSICLCGTRFWFLLRLQKIHLPYFRTLHLTFVGFFFNLFLIGSTGGDAIRLYYLLRWFPEQKTRATLSILLDRVFGVAALFGLALLFLPGTTDRLRADPAFLPLAQALPWLGSLGAVLLLLAFLLPGFLPHLPLPKKIPGRAIILDLLHGIRDTAHGGWNTIGLVGVALCVHLTSFAGATLLAHSLDLPINYSLAGLILVLVFSASALPISVSGHGVREGVMVFLFAHLGLGAGPESAIAYSLLLYGIGLFWSLFGGLAYLTLQSPKKQT